MTKQTSKSAAKRRCLHLICGTHWDREWRYNYEQSLIRLVELIDATVEILEKHPEMGCFHLDGGTVMLERSVPGSGPDW